MSTILVRASVVLTISLSVIYATAALAEPFELGQRVSSSSFQTDQSVQMLWGITQNAQVAFRRDEIAPARGGTWNICKGLASARGGVSSASWSNDPNAKYYTVVATNDVQLVPIHDPSTQLYNFLDIGSLTTDSDTGRSRGDADCTCSVFTDVPGVVMTGPAQVLIDDYWAGPAPGPATGRVIHVASVGDDGRLYLFQYGTDDFVNSPCGEPNPQPLDEPGQWWGNIWNPIPGPNDIALVAGAVGVVTDGEPSFFVRTISGEIARLIPDPNNKGWAWDANAVTVPKPISNSLSATARAEGNSHVPHLFVTDAKNALWHLAIRGNNWVWEKVSAPNGNVQLLGSHDATSCVSYKVPNLPGLPEFVEVYAAGLDHSLWWNGFFSDNKGNNFWLGWISLGQPADQAGLLGVSSLRAYLAKGNGQTLLPSRVVGLDNIDSDDFDGGALVGRSVLTNWYSHSYPHSFRRPSSDATLRHSNAMLAESRNLMALVSSRADSSGLIPWRTTLDWSREDGVAAGSGAWQQEVLIPAFNDLVDDTKDDGFPLFDDRAYRFDSAAAFDAASNNAVLVTAEVMSSAQSGIAVDASRIYFRTTNDGTFAGLPTLLEEQDAAPAGGGYLSHPWVAIDPVNGFRHFAWLNNGVNNPQGEETIRYALHHPSWKQGPVACDLAHSGAISPDPRVFVDAAGAPYASWADQTGVQLCKVTINAHLVCHPIGCNPDSGPNCNPNGQVCHVEITCGCGPQVNMDLQFPQATVDQSAVPITYVRRQGDQLVEHSALMAADEAWAFSASPTVGGRIYYAWQARRQLPPVSPCSQSRDIYLSVSETNLNQWTSPILPEGTRAVDDCNDYLMPSIATVSRRTAGDVPAHPTRPFDETVIVSYYGHSHIVPAQLSPFDSLWAKYDVSPDSGISFNPAGPFLDQEDTDDQTPSGIDPSGLPFDWLQFEFSLGYHHYHQNVRGSTHAHTVFGEAPQSPNYGGLPTIATIQNSSVSGLCWGLRTPSQ
jgi:hypothetical protein